MDQEKKERFDKMIADLEGTCQSLQEVAERYDLDDMDPEVAEAVDHADIFLCDSCGWWFERCEESTGHPGSCDDCHPEKADDDD